MNEQAAELSQGNPRHFPKIRGGANPPPWLLEHTARNMHALGPSPDLLAEWNIARLVLPDLAAMRRYRLERVRELLRRENCDAALLHDPLNIRYATDGPVIVFEFSDAEPLNHYPLGLVT